MAGYNPVKLSIEGASIVPKCMQIIAWEKPGYNRKFLRLHGQEECLGKSTLLPGKNSVITGKL